ncbi:hypothetical protein Tco_0848323 [Tanacetum coccineum]
MEFQVGDKVMLKISPWKGVVHFGKQGKLNPRYVRPFKVLEKVGEVAYKLELPEELSRVHNTFYFVEEPVDIMDREVKWLNQSRIPLVKVASDDLREALSAIYLLFAHLRGSVARGARFWKSVKLVVNANETIRFKMDRQEVTYTVDMFCATLKLLVETPAHPFIAQQL